VSFSLNESTLFSTFPMRAAGSGRACRVAPEAFHAREHFLSRYVLCGFSFMALPSKKEPAIFVVSARRENFLSPMSN